MGIIQLLMAVLVVMMLAGLAGDLSTDKLIQVTVLALVTLLVLHGLKNWCANAFINMLYNPEGARVASRRKMGKQGQSARTRAEARLEAMSEDRLRRHIEKHPRDGLAIEILSERLKADGRLDDYARNTEYLLIVQTTMALEEACTRYHELADYYWGVGRREKAREMMHALIGRFPLHYQATLARRRLEEMAEQEKGENDQAARGGPADDQVA